MSDILGYLLAGLVCMLVLSFVRNKYYKISAWKIIVSMILMVIAGVTGTAVLFFVESGRWGGTSFYGSVFLIPIVFSIVGLALKIPYGKMMDICAVPICAMLVVMKVRCVEAGCCAGRVLYEQGTEKVVFPSQIVEAFVVFVIMLILMHLEKNVKYRNKMYPLFLVLYGSTRLILNSFRVNLSAFVWILPAGHFWSLVAVVLGGTVLFLVCRKSRTKNNIS